MWLESYTFYVKCTFFLCVLSLCCVGGRVLYMCRRVHLEVTGQLVGFGPLLQPCGFQEWGFFVIDLDGNCPYPLSHFASPSPFFFFFKEAFANTAVRNVICSPALKPEQDCCMAFVTCVYFVLCFSSRVQLRKVTCHSLLTCGSLSAVFVAPEAVHSWWGSC